MKKNNKISTVNELFELIYLMLDFEKQIRNYGTDVQLSSSEIYLVKCISENANCNVTMLAELIGVSKAAISQMIKKLEKKGVITIGYDRENRSRYQINLTDKGIAANTVHLNLKQEMFESIYNLLDDYNDNEVERVRQFVAMAGKQIKNRINKS